MKKSIISALVIISWTHIAHSQFYHDSQHQRTPKAIAAPRTGYVSSVIHQDPRYTDQSAQSSVKVNFDSHSGKNVGTYRPKSVSGYQQSQLFNVGYSVRFNNAATTKSPYLGSQLVKRKPDLDNGEIITGKRKQNEHVEIPNWNMSPQEYVSQALLSHNKKSSVTNPKLQSFIDSQNSQSVIRQTSFSPKTQKFVKALEETKAIQLSNQRYRDMQKTQKTDFKWKNISPSVEIVRSAEIPLVQKNSFNHAGALQNSQNFDFSNGLDNTGLPSGTQYIHSKNYELPQHTDVRSLVAGSELFPSNSKISIAGPNQTPPNLPLDTSLLRDPVITTSGIDIPNDPNIIPIRFDLTSMKGYLSEPENSVQNAFNAQSNLLQHQKEIAAPKYVQKDYQASTEPEMSVGYENYLPSVQNHFKIYGNPQPTKDLYKSLNQPRQPRFDYSVKAITDLRPPAPAQNAYQSMY